MRVAVVGHVEWVEFVRVERVPMAGEIVHAERGWEEPAGGGGVSVVHLLDLAGRATLFTALGDDDLGHRAAAELERLGVRVHAAHRTDEPQRRAVTFLDDAGERTITTIGHRLTPRGDDPLPWEELDQADAVYLTAGDAAAMHAARRARVLVATSRVLADLVAADVRLDALVGSEHDEAERFELGTMQPAPGLEVLTSGRDGGRYLTADGTTGSWDAAPIPGPVEDAYGAGDSFAAGLTHALGAGMGTDQALAFAAARGALALTRRGAHGGR